ncbi:MAG: 50S ribosomal protein L5 [Candidatus Pacebacteria bacterium]|nr:50S ribosomal protein L5 [Candidatus Paceibacterota bacterium]
MMKLKEKYKKEIIPAMMERFGYKSKMAVPKIEKVVINTGFGRLVAQKTKQEREKIIKEIIDDLAMICGQRPILTLARKSVSGFKIRKGMPIGAKVTLREEKMYDFLERLIYIALPRTRDFKGIDPKSIDKERNLTIGIKEHIVFPEVATESLSRIFGFEITIVTTAKTREEAEELLKLIGVPIKQISNVKTKIQI